MTDIFISYSRADRAIAEALAEELKARGYLVWWDAELVGSDDFYDVIQQALDNAKAAIVIWTKASTKSRFVRDEARLALHLDKLVATREKGLDTFDIPLGFQGQHTEEIGNTERIAAAIEKLGALPQRKLDPAKATPEEVADADWRAVQSSRRAEDLLDFLAKHPAAPQRDACLTRLRALAIDTGSEAHTISSRSVASKLRSFLSGFSFRMPGFQSLSSGTYSAIGGVVFYILLSVAAPLLIMSNLQPRPYGYITLAAVCAVLALLGLMRFRGWLKQRNFVAAFLTALAVAGVAGLAAFAVAVEATATELKEDILWVFPATSAAVVVVLSGLLLRGR